MAMDEHTKRMTIDNGNTVANLLMTFTALNLSESNAVNIEIRAANSIT